MQLLRMIPLLALLATPLAAAGEAPDTCYQTVYYFICANEGSWGEDCPEPDTTGYRYSGVDYVVEDVASGRVEGGEGCWWFTNWDDTNDTMQSRYVIVHSAGPIHWVDAGWSSFDRVTSEEEFHECSTWVYVEVNGEEATYQDLGCPAGGPPALPWGSVIP